MGIARVWGRRVALGMGVVGAVAAATAAGERVARACGGCVQPAPPPAVHETESVITDEKMLFSISKDQTTLYDEITYSGSPSSFGWILPIRGEVTVGLSADILFQTLEQATATQVISPPTGCPPAPVCNFGYGGGGFSCACGSSAAAGEDGGAGPEDAATADSGVNVISQRQVGPYETVQLKSSDGSALDSWLTEHGYVVHKDEQPVIDAYVKEHFDFLALKLIPGKGVQTMQPVRVTSKGANLSLPLHMVAIGTGATTGITIWVVADGRWEPSNFPFFTIDDSKIVWDWATGSSNYESLRLSEESKFQGRGWQIESSLEQNKQSFTDQLITNAEGDNTPGSGGGYLLGPRGGGDAGPGEGGPGEGGPGDGGSGDGGPGDGGSGDGTAGDASPGDAGLGDAGLGDAALGDAEAMDATIDAEAAATDAGEAGDAPPPPPATQAEAVRRDMAVLFAGIAGPNFRVTRMRSDVAHSALSVDMFLQASTDQQELTNIHQATDELGQPQCPIYDNNCNQVETLPRDQAIANGGQVKANGGCSATPERRRTRLSVTLTMGILALGMLRYRSRRRRRDR